MKSERRAQSKAAFQAILPMMGNCFPGPLHPVVRYVTVGSVDADGMQRAVVEMRVQATSLAGMELDNYYCWVLELQVSKEQPIVRVRAYMDSALVRDLLDGDREFRERSAKPGASS